MLSPELGTATLTSDDPSLPDPSPLERRRSEWIPVVALSVLLATPFIIALRVLHSPQWFPINEFALIEFRVRDVGVSHPPLVGLPGRIGSPYAILGSHPGPLSFWAMAPIYRVFGATAWASQAAAVSLHLVAVALALWIASRRGGLAVTLGVAATIALVAHAYGPYTLVAAGMWNGYLPLLWWLLFLLSVWAVVDDDVPMLVLVALAGSLCVQTHVSYSGLVASLGALAAGSAAWRTYRHRSDRRRRRRFVGWLAAATGIGLLVWVSPLIDQARSSGGNLSRIVDYFGNPPLAPVGVITGVKLMLLHLNPWKLATTHVVVLHTPTDVGAIALVDLLPAVLLVIAWTASVAVAWRFRRLALLRLDLVIALALLLGVVTTSRIFGPAFPWLVLWGWGLGALMLFALGWAGALLFSATSYGTSARRRTAVRGVALAFTLLFVMLFTIAAAHVDNNVSTDSKAFDELAPATVQALSERTRPEDERDGPLLVTASDGVTFGISGVALMNELEREGFEVVTTTDSRLAVRSHRVIERDKIADDVSAVIHIAVGADIDAWRTKDRVEEVAYADPRDRGQRVEFERLRAQLVEELEQAGFDELTPFVDGSRGLMFDTRLPPKLHEHAVRLAELGAPVAVFVGPPEPVAA